MPHGLFKEFSALSLGLGNRASPFEGSSRAGLNRPHCPRGPHIFGSQEVAEDYCRECHCGEIDDEPGQIRAGPVIQMADPKRSGGTADSVCGPGQTIKGRKVPATEIACQQVGANIGFTAEPDSEGGGSQKSEWCGPGKCKN